MRTKSISTLVIPVNAIRLAVILLVANVYSAAIRIGAQDGSPVSSFEAVILPKTDKYPQAKVNMEALWEIDLSKTAIGEGKDDPEQNNFNLFVVDDVLYLYISSYTNENCQIRRYDTRSGSKLPTINIPFPLSGQLPNATMMPDDAGHLCLVYLRHTTDKATRGHVIYCLDESMTGFNLIADNRGKLDGYVNPICEYQGLTGDVTTGNFVLSWNGYHGVVYNQSRYPATGTLKFVNGKTRDFELSRFDSDNFYQFESKYISSVQHDNIIHTNLITEGLYLAQAYGTSAGTKGEKTADHSPILLYKDNGMTMDGYCLLSQVDALTSEELQFKDDFCFGAFPVNIGGHQLLILPSEFNADNGVKFNVAHWPDLNSFTGITKLWTFPNGDTTFPESPSDLFSGDKIFTPCRPKIVVTYPEPTPSDIIPMETVQEMTSPANEATAYVYMPGALIGAYKISANPTTSPSGAVEIPDENYMVALELSDKILNVSTDKKTRIIILSTYGSSLMEMSVESDCSINLSELPAGVYIVRAGDISRKIILH